MNLNEQQTVKAALDQIEAVIRDLNWGIPNGYVMGYELGYMKGVLEHILRTHPDIQTRGAYLQGYINGYSQGLLYLVRSNAVARPPGLRRGISRRALSMQRNENLVRGDIYGTTNRSTDRNANKDKENYGHKDNADETNLSQ